MTKLAMASPGRAHDRAVLDALDAIDPEPFVGELWRIAPVGRDPLRGSAANGRCSRHFLEFDGLIVPSARYDCLNVVFYTERLATAGGAELRSSERVDWNEWRLHR